MEENPRIPALGHGNEISFLHIVLLMDDNPQHFKTFQKLIHQSALVKAFQCKQQLLRCQAEHDSGDLEIRRGTTLSHSEAAHTVFFMSRTAVDETLATTANIQCWKSVGNVKGTTNWTRRHNAFILRKGLYVEMKTYYDSLQEQTPIPEWFQITEIRTYAQLPTEQKDTFPIRFWDCKDTDVNSLWLNFHLIDSHSRYDQIRRQLT